MFGLGFGELVVILIVGMVVLGPKELPRVLRQAGIWAGRLRRLAADMRAQSGIDELIREEGLDKDLAEIRKLARGDINGVISSAEAGWTATRKRPTVTVEREREFPKDGADSYGALPERSSVYGGDLPASEFAKSALYTDGLLAEEGPNATKDEGPK